MEKIKHKGLISVLVILSLVPVFIVAHYNHPSADDYGYPLLTKYIFEQGGNIFEVLKAAIQTTLRLMNEWQGIYSATALMALMPAAFGDQYYALTTYIIVGMLYIGLASLFSSLIHNYLRVKSRDAYFLALVVAFYLIQAMPIPVEGLFWYNGVINYMFFWGVALCDVALLFRYWNHEKTCWGSMIGAAVLSFLISGANHVTAFACILIEITFVIFTIIKRKRFLSIVPLATGLFGFILNLTAPGTAIRMAKDGADNSIITTVIRSGYQALVVNSKYLTFSLIVLLIILTPTLLKLIQQSEERLKFSGKHLIGILLFDYVLISAMHCVPYMAMGRFGEGRVEDIYFVTYVLLAVLTYGYALACLINCKEIRSLIKRATQKLAKKTVRSTVSGILIIATCYIAAVGNGQNDLSTGFSACWSLAAGTVQQYDLEYYNRIEILEDDSVSDAVLEPYTVQPYLLFFRELETDPSEWPNYRVAQYYGKNSVSMISGTDKNG